MDLTTRLIHHGYQAPKEFAAPQIGIHKASTVFFPNVAAMRAYEWKDKTAYTYGLHGTPTTYTLEERLCYLEGAKHCVLVPSGLAAVALVALSVLKVGDEVLIPDNAYGPNKALAEAELKSWGITHQYYDPMDPEDLAAQISSRTKLVWIEAAGSVTLEFPDVISLVKICKNRNILTAMDNTWGAGLAFKPFDLMPSEKPQLGVDITAHALTKYPSGGGDVLMGSVMACDDALAMRIKLTHMRLGYGVGANDVELVLRSLPSIALRYSAQDACTRSLARWAQSQPEFIQVLHPALVDSPGHTHWQTLCNNDFGGAACMFSVVLAPHFNQEEVDAFCDALSLFKIGYSWAGPVSLVMPYQLETMRQSWPAHLLRGTLVRFSIGLEQVQDLQDDIAQALRILR
jgi:cystathionine beta-lyase